MKVSVAKLSAWFLIIGALCNFALIPWFIYKSITNDASYDYLLIFSYGIAIIFFGIHCILAFFVKCPHCGKLLMVRGFKSPQAGTHDSGMEVGFFWFTNKVSCMHCGSKIDTKSI